jgi:hypothetical protein
MIPVLLPFEKPLVLQKVYYVFYAYVSCLIIETKGGAKDLPHLIN